MERIFLLLYSSVQDSNYYYNLYSKGFYPAAPPHLVSLSVSEVSTQKTRNMYTGLPIVPGLQSFPFCQCQSQSQLNKERIRSGHSSSDFLGSSREGGRQEISLHPRADKHPPIHPQPPAAYGRQFRMSAKQNLGYVEEGGALSIEGGRRGGR